MQEAEQRIIGCQGDWSHSPCPLRASGTKPTLWSATGCANYSHFHRLWVASHPNATWEFLGVIRSCIHWYQQHFSGTYLHISSHTLQHNNGLLHPLNMRVFIFTFRGHQFVRAGLYLIKQHGDEAGIGLVLVQQCFVLARSGSLSGYRSRRSISGGHHRCIRRLPEWRVTYYIKHVPHRK